MFKRYYHFTNPYIQEMIKAKYREFWWYFSLIIIPLGLTLYSPVATFIDRLDGVSAAAGISFWKEMTENHLVSLVAGITFLIFFEVGFFSVDLHDMARWSTVSSATRRMVWKPEEVDAEANAPDAEWLPNLGIILAPDIVIGFWEGVHVATYEDVEGLQIVIDQRRIHLGLFKWKDMDTFELYPAGRAVSGILLTESLADPELCRMEVDILRERCQQYHPDRKVKLEVWDDRKKRAKKNDSGKNS